MFQISNCAKCRVRLQTSVQRIQQHVWVSFKKHCIQDKTFWSISRTVLCRSRADWRLWKPELTLWDSGLIGKMTALWYQRDLCHNCTASLSSQFEAQFFLWNSAVTLQRGRRAEDPGTPPLSGTTPNGTARDQLTKTVPSH